MAIKSGAYFVYFESNLGTSGVGTIVVNGSRISGGDGGYIYRGFVLSIGGRHYGRIAVIRVDPGAESIFGSADRFELEISGCSLGASLKFSGHVLGWEHLRVRFNLRSAIALAAE
jgi:hypothetical protein